MPALGRAARFHSSLRSISPLIPPLTLSSSLSLRASHTLSLTHSLSPPCPPPPVPAAVLHVTHWRTRTRRLQPVAVHTWHAGLAATHGRDRDARAGWQGASSSAGSPAVVAAGSTAGGAAARAPRGARANQAKNRTKAHAPDWGCATKQFWATQGRINTHRPNAHRLKFS